MQGTLSLAGRCTYLTPGSPWWANIEREDWPEGLAEAIAPLWNETSGDRQTELVLIGRDMNPARVKDALESCLLSEQELVAMPPEAWATVCV